MLIKIVMASAYFALLVLVLRRRILVAFPAYLAYEIGIIFGFDPDVEWHSVYLEAGALLLRCAAAAEAWLHLTWVMPRKERRQLGGVGVMLGGLAVAITLAAWPLETAVSTMNQVSLSLNLVAGCTLGSAALWLILFPVRKRGFVHAHAAVMTAYIGILVGVMIGYAVPDATATLYESLRMTFNAGALGCISAWSWAELFQRRHLRT